MAAFTLNNLNAGTPQSISTTAGAATSCIWSAGAATGATTLRRIWIMEWEIGATAVPNSTDCPIMWDISQQTAAGTATSIVPIPNDQGGGDAAALGTYNVNYTAIGTITASTSIWHLALNQRASYRVQMRDEYHAIIVAATNLKGWTGRAWSPNYASTVNWRALVKE